MMIKVNSFSTRVINDFNYPLALVWMAPKPVKVAPHILCSLLSKAINNNSLLQGIFPDDAKIASFFISQRYF